MAIGPQQFRHTRRYAMVAEQQYIASMQTAQNRQQNREREREITML